MFFSLTKTHDYRTEKTDRSIGRPHRNDDGISFGMNRYSVRREQ